MNAEDASLGITCVVLAAGRATRFGIDKTLALVEGRTLVARAVDACAGFDVVAVASPQNAGAFRGFAYVVNDRPERGMSHSLALAHASVAADRALVVVLADMPFVTNATVRAVAARLASGVDVAYPWDGVRPGHPVGFGVVARARIARLPGGDTLRRLRDDPTLRASRVAVDDPGAYHDVDVPADLTFASRSGRGPT